MMNEKVAASGKQEAGIKSGNRFLPAPPAQKRCGGRPCFSLPASIDEVFMKLAGEIYEFGAHAGSFEGYVYGYTRVDLAYLPGWAANLLKEYRSLPDGIRAEIQPGLDMTLGRAVRSLAPHLGENHQVLGLLEEMIQGNLPDSPDDFTRDAQVKPGSYREIYEFGAKAGAFEGYVYKAEKAACTGLLPWAENLVKKWRALPSDVRAAIEPSTGLTLGRAIQSLKSCLHEKDGVIVSLKEIVKGKLPASADDFVRH
jgi:hypothetical protein